MKSGFIAVIGRANAGKSTLVNVLVGEKVAIVSPKPQTTRDRITGILNTPSMQAAFIDTPGIYRADNLLNSLMQRRAETAAEDVDLVLFVIDAHEGLGERDKALAKKFATGQVPCVTALTKTDIMPETLLISEIKELSEFCTDIVPVSARKGKNVRELLRVIETRLPEGEPLFPEGIISDRSERFMIAEIMREKILLKFDREVPHGVAVRINGIEDKGGVANVNLDIICEKANHKPILIGKRGAAIKEVSQMAREDMEKFLGKFTKGFGALYGVINLLSDVLSYARLFGLMLSGMIVATTFNDMGLGLMTGGLGYVFGPLVIVVGHVFNIAMGVLGAYIHDSRLQYIEFFSKFYTGEGEKFTPLGSDLEYIYLTK